MKTIIKFIKKLLRKPKSTAASIHPSFIIPRSKHQLSKTDMSVNALKVLNRLNQGGFEAYLVGGSVRDLMLRKSPKDFDIATNATPNEVKKLFRNARIIGRRFKLVHILFHREIIEVATFRSDQSIDTSSKTNDRGMLILDNAFGGTSEEDARRRDFTVNALYYNIQDSTIIDFTGGVDDIHQQLIRMIGDPITRYHEDPVRMLRAIRFSAKLNFKIAPQTADPIKELAHLITHVSNSRLFDEMTKLYQCGAGEQAHRLLFEFNLLQHLFPHTHKLLTSEYPVSALLGIALENTDTRIRENKPVTPAFIFAVLLWFPLLDAAKQLQAEGIDPLPAIEQAMSLVIAEQNKIISIPKRFTQVMREIWIMQYRFPKRVGKKPFQLLQHPRFRAAYDFLALRALIGDAPMDLAQWWTSFQEVDFDTQKKMIASSSPKKRKRSSSKKS